MKTPRFTHRALATYTLLLGLSLGCAGGVHGGDIDPALVGSWPAFPAGPAEAVAVSGNYAYVAMTTGYVTPPLNQRSDLQVLDVSDVRNPRWVGGCDTGGPARRLALVGNYAYAANSSSFQVIDLSDRIHPRRLGECDSGGSPSGLAVANDYAYLALGSGGVLVIDVSAPPTPRSVTRYQAAGGELHDVALSGYHAYVAGWWHETNRFKQGLQVVDVSVPSSPQRVASLNTDTGPIAVAVDGNRAYLADFHGGVRVIDITNPLQPQALGSYNAPQPAVTVAKAMTVSGDRLYLAEEVELSSPSMQCRVEIIDVSNPASPQRLGGYAASLPPFAFYPPLGVAILGQHVLVTSGGILGRLDVVDVSNPADPQWVSGHSGAAAWSVALSGDYAYLAYASRGLQVVDVSDPAHPVSVGALDTEGLAWAVAVADRYAYVADGVWEEGVTRHTGGLHIIDISDPARSIRVGRHEAGGDARGVAVAGHYAYVAGGAWLEDTNQHPGGLWIVDVSDPVSPLLVGNHATSGNARAVTVSGSYAYLALEGVYDGTNYVGAGLEIIDISNPADPKRKAAYATRESARGVAVAGNHAYVATGGVFGGGLQVIDVTIPAIPLLVAEYDPDGSSATGVTVSDGYAYLAGGWTMGDGRMISGGLQILEISNPAQPQLLGRYRDSGPIAGLAVFGRFAYLGEGSSFRVIDLSRRANPQQLNICDTPARALDAVVAGNYAYVADGSWESDTNWHGGGLQVIDLSTPAKPKLVGACDGGLTRAVALAGNYAYVADEGAWNGTNYVDAGLQVIDISDPLSPQRVGGCIIGDGMSVWDVAVSGNYAYLSGGRWDEGAQIQRDNLIVIDISSPSEPRRVGSFDSVGFGYAVALLGSYAYLAGDVAGLQVIEISAPENPRQVGSYGALTAARSVAVSGSFAYVVDAKAGLHVIDITSPANPQWVGQYAEGSANRWSDSTVTVLGAYVYVGHASTGLEVLDISDPAQPRRVGGNSVFSPSGLAVNQSRVLVAGGSDGLGILEMQPFFKSISNVDSSLRLQWEGFGSARLQRATSLTPPVLWQDLLGSENTNRVTLPVWSGSEFFRLVRP